MTTSQASDSRARDPLRVGFLLVEKFTLNAFSGFIDALRLAADGGGRSRQIHCGWEIMGEGDVTASCGLRTRPTSGLRDPREFDFIAVCGGNGYPERHQPRELTEYLRRSADAGVPLIGVCTGTFNIARAGLLDGYLACVHWNVFDEFRAQFPAIDARPDRIFIDAGQRIACAGSAGATDLALHLIARHCGRARAQQAVRHMMLQGIRPAMSPQAHFNSEMQSVKDPRVRAAARLMEQRLNEPMPMDEVARQVGISLRQLERCFETALGQTPVAFYRRLRLVYGRHLLLHTIDSVARIANDAGFSDSAHFSREFKRCYGVGPREFRKRDDRQHAGEDGAEQQPAS